MIRFATRWFFRAGAAAALLLACSRAQADDSWTLLQGDLRPHTVTLDSIDDAGVHISEAGTARVISLADFVEVSRTGGAEAAPADVGSGFTLYLTAGDRVSGMPVSVNNDDLLWHSDSIGDVHLSMRRVRAMVKAGAQPPDGKRPEDIVTMSNGDTVRGIVIGMTKDKVTIQKESGQNADLSLASVGQVAFATTIVGGGAESADFRVRLDDGTSVEVPSVKAHDQKLTVALAAGASHDIDMTHVMGIEQVNGPVSWLSTRSPSQHVYTPYYGTDEDFPARMDRTVDGKPIQFKDQTFPRGIGIHADSRLSWALDPKYTAFQTRYAIDGDLPKADLTVTIKLDDKIAYQKKDVRAGELSDPVRLDLNGAKTITLEVTSEQPFNVQGRLNWIAPALLAHKPSPAEQPAPPTTLPDSTPTTLPTVTPPTATTQPAAPRSTSMENLLGGPAR